MRLENIVWDARDPRRLGRFWAAAVGADVMTEEPDVVEARLSFSDDVFLDLCFQRVAAPSTSPARLQPELAGGARPEGLVRRLVDLGAEPVDTGPGAVPGIVLADPEGNPFRVPRDLDPHLDPHLGTGPIAALPLDSADPERDAGFWAGITGWVPWAGTPGTPTLRHPSGVGPLLQFRPESGPDRGKNRLHLDVRRDAGDDDVLERLPAWGATPLSAPGEYPWLVFADPSGNEFCVLAPPR